MPADYEGREKEIEAALDELEKKVVRTMMVEQRRRIDGRAFDEIRPISIEVGKLPRTHGSALFTRGETQVIAVVTLGSSSDEQKIEALAGETFKSFMLHYNFPPFSVGEVRPLRGPGRREIGHGALAERAIKPSLPKNGEFPYTIRVVSEVLESNGSSSMATVCGASLGPYGRRSAGFGFGSGHSHGADQRRRRVHRPFGYSWRRGPSGGHGFQSYRNRKGHNRLPDGRKNIRSQPGDIEKSPRSGQGRAAPHPWKNEGSHCGTQVPTFTLCPQSGDHSDQSR